MLVLFLVVVWRFRTVTESILKVIVLMFLLHFIFSVRYGLVMNEIEIEFEFESLVHCSNIKTCESPQIIPYGRGFFFLTIVVLTTIYSSQIAVAKALLQTRRRRRNSEEHTTPLLPTTTTTRRTDEAEEEEEIIQDIQILQKKLLKGLVKPCILGTLHFTLGLMALLFVSSCRAINSLPFWYVCVL